MSVLDQQLKLFVSRHSAFLSEQVPGQRTLHHHGDVLDTRVVLNPAVDFCCSEVQQLVSSPSRHKLLILAAQFLEDSGDLVLQKGCFSANHLLHILEEEEVKVSASRSSLTLSCPDYGLWMDSALRKNLQSFHVQINPPFLLPPMEGLQEFTEYLSESVEPESPFDLLEPPSTVGFLKLSRPCCYIFPGGRGDSSFFSVNGFNMLVNGGSDPRSCFWKLVRHLDRIDSVLLTHMGVDNLPGVNSLLLRKAAEQEVSGGPHPEEERLKGLISPELGVVFLNAPERRASAELHATVLRSCDEAALMLQHLHKLEVPPQQLSAGAGPGPEPLILFQKMGVGRLELYVLNPVSGSKHLETFMQMWPERSGSTSDLPLTCLTSICALLVWHPFSPQEKIIRILFPGCTPQSKVLEGLQKINNLAFLKHPVVCVKDLESPKTESQVKQRPEAESREWRPGRSSQKDELLHGDLKKKDVKVKPKAAGETAAKERKDGSEKATKEADVKSKSVKPVSKSGPKKDLPKEDRRDEAPSSAAETKREGTKVKKDLKPEPKKGGKKDVKTDGNKSTKAGSKEVKKAPGLAVGSSEARKALGKSASQKRDVTLPKKAAPGAKNQKETPLLKRGVPQAGRPEPDLITSNGLKSTRSNGSREAPEKEADGDLGGGLCPVQPTGDIQDNRLIQTCSQDVGLDSAATMTTGGSLSSDTCNLNGHLCPESGPALVLTPSCNGGGGALVHELSQLDSAAPHDVDLCLVSPCEFQHPKTPENHKHQSLTACGPSDPASTPPSEGPSRSQCPPECDAPPSTEECCSITEDLDSEDDQAPPQTFDPPPAPIKDHPPVPPQPGACMADADMEAVSKNIKISAAKNKRPTSAPQKVNVSIAGRSRVSTGSSSFSSQAPSRTAAPRGPSSDPGGPVIYVDLAYLPSGPAASTVDAEFFRCLRSLHYIISGDDDVKAAAMRSILDALLEGKSSWPEVQVTLIPTFDSLPMHDWYQDTHERQKELKITVLGSNSTVAMQGETFPACKVEF